MTSREEEFLASLRATFAEEASEHVHEIASGLLALDQSPEQLAPQGIVERIFRAAHSLKGAARAVEFSDVEQACQAMEDMFASWQKRGGTPSRASVDAMHDALNQVTAALADPRSPEPAGISRKVAASAVEVPARAWVHSTGSPSAAVMPAQGDIVRKVPAGQETVRISVAKLEAQLLKAEEMLTAKLNGGQGVEELRQLAHHASAWRAPWAAAEPAARALRQFASPDTRGERAAQIGVTRLLEFVEWNVEFLKSVETRVATLTNAAARNQHVVGKLVDDLLDDSKQLLLLPFGTLAAQFPKLVRDLLHDQGKEGVLVIRGEDVEIDKRILEDMKDPLIHILRNCVDHGIETPEQRARAGKATAATITITVSQVDGSRVQILVTDDGAGIDASRVKASALKEGALSAEDAHTLADDAACDLIFRPNVTTASIITRVSGRGLGMAIVRERAEKLGGFVSVTSAPGIGTQFRIVLPALLATFRGIAIQAAERLFIVPTTHTERVARVKRDHVKTVEGRETVVLGGRAVSLVWMADVLELPRTASPSDASAAIPLVVLGAGDQRIAFAVDEVLDEQEVLVKPLRSPLSRVRHVSGVTVLGSGEVVPILHVADLLRSGGRAAAFASRPAAVPTASAPVASVLVAEDSITSRVLIKGILESAGYRVTTAVDGMEAFTLLRAGDFDLLVTDVEMPRLNGFDLAARVRADVRLAELPVVLLTALEKREDRERGVDVGANAYIVKSSFAQSDLLDAVRRLL